MNYAPETSLLGPEWTQIYSSEATFSKEDFKTAMNNLIRQPNINSTVILRADILSENGEDTPLAHTKPDIQITDPEQVLLITNTDDTSPRPPQIAPDHTLAATIVRRIIPRNPFKDPIINQTCCIVEIQLGGEGTEHSGDKESKDKENKNYTRTEIGTLITYEAHISNKEETPFYLPLVRTIGILLLNNTISVHYLPFSAEQQDSFKDPTDRNVRIAYRLLQTAVKHSNGVMRGYQKRVHHDLVVSKTSFQDRYISLKNKYAKHLVDNWRESTDPRKHVFEDIAIAAFLIELWNKIYPSTKEESFEFRDLGCGNGILVYILISEGYKGVGIDARARKSWKLFPLEVQASLKEQVIIPSVLLRPHPSLQSMAPHIVDNGRIFQVPITNTDVPTISYYSSSILLNSPNVNTAEFPKNTFVIGNHSDELTCWIPLLGYPFMVLPCCSHSLSGAKVRYPSRSANSSSTYAALVDQVEVLSKQVGWKVEKEMLRIPSTRNAALISYNKDDFNPLKVYEVLSLNGGAEAWVENTMNLMIKPPRNH